MRRKDRQVTNLSEINKIINMCKTCHIAMVEEGMPYLIPLSFGYEFENNQLVLYFHSANTGKKIDILKKNNHVCFEMCCEGEAIYEETSPCSSGYYFSSVHGFGEVEFLEENVEKAQALSAIMKHQMDAAVTFAPEQVRSVCVFKIAAATFSAKQKTN